VFVFKRSKSYSKELADKHIVLDKKCFLRSKNRVLNSIVPLSLLPPPTASLQLVAAAISQQQAKS
jgi:hypothetical protein